MGKSPKMELPLEDGALDEVCRGMSYASLAITDNKKGTLAKVGRVNPWHIEALKVITGSEERAHRPLKTILYEDMDELELDWEIDVSGVTKGGQFLDTQGYIAHNDDYIVLSFRCTTSAFDWLTNFNTTSSAWELEEDLAQGYSGLCSGLDGLCCNGGEYKPRVHTGFYNNFLSVLPTIKRHINPLLQTYSRPRTLYVVGHSLGAGIASLAACYFMLEYNWLALPQSMVVVTAGSPRAVCESMKEVIDRRRRMIGPKVRMYRVVKGSDAVVSVPPKILGFRHLIDPIYITDGGRVVLRTNQYDPETDLLALTKFAAGEDLVENYDYDESENPKTKYDRQVARIPKALRDHMPDFYLKPLLNAQGRKQRSPSPPVSEASTADESDGPEGDGNHDYGSSQIKKVVREDGRKQVHRTWMPKMFKKRQQENPATAVYW